MSDEQQSASDLHREVERASKSIERMKREMGRSKATSRMEWLDRLVLVAILLVAGWGSLATFHQNQEVLDARERQVEVAEQRQEALLNETDRLLRRLEDRALDAELSRTEFRRAVDLIFDALEVDVPDRQWQDFPYGG